MQQSTTIADVEVRSPSLSSPDFRRASVTSVGIPPLVEPLDKNGESVLDVDRHAIRDHASLIIERGEAANTTFHLTADESYIGRWDADNGIFPDVDLDAYDPDAKVSRRHARIVRGQKSYTIEDLGSTNGTFVNRGRRLLPGSPQVLNEGDEIIVGKTFLRFRINQ
ncbi:MAG: FHA domain-containing protein [Pyrinomonadaceae bacterium]|nr:FHA domain-containing protein [Pyrinomonadaceae bacterium]